MDWNQANVGLDQEAFRAAQAAGDTGFSIPLWIILLVAIVVAVSAYAIAKKKSGNDSSGASSSDKK